jgi:hypothetical protein
MLHIRSFAFRSGSQISASSMALFGCNTYDLASEYPIENSVDKRDPGSNVVSDNAAQ